MTRFEFTLPDTLAQEAQRAGVLTQDRVEQWVRQQVNRQKLDRLFRAVDQVAETTEEHVSPEEVSLELEAMRAEKRTR
jgi:hypothetical protein